MQRKSRRRKSAGREREARGVDDASHKASAEFGRGMSRTTTEELFITFAYAPSLIGTESSIHRQVFLL